MHSHDLTNDPWQKEQQIQSELKIFVLMTAFKTSDANLLHPSVRF
jgi:hypothetical protein